MLDTRGMFVNLFEFKETNLFEIRKNVWLSRQYFYIFCKQFVGEKVSRLYRRFKESFNSAMYAKKFEFILQQDFKIDEETKQISEKIKKYEELYTQDDHLFLKSFENGFKLIKSLTGLNLDLLNTEITPEIRKQILNIQIADIIVATETQQKINCGIKQNLFDFTIARETILNKGNTKVNPQFIFQELLILREAIPYYTKYVLPENEEKCFNLLKMFEINNLYKGSFAELIQEIKDAKIEELFFKYGLELNKLANILFFSATDKYNLFIELFIGAMREYSHTDFEILGERNHLTLDEIGQKFNLTRERVRQKIDKMVNEFNEFYLKNFTFKSIDFMFVFTEHSYFFDFITLKDILKYDYAATSFLFKKLNPGTSTGYLKQLHGFFSSNEHFEKFLEVEKQVFNDYFKEEDLLLKIKEIRQLLPNFKMTKNSIKTYVSDTFYLRKGTYIRYKFSLSKAQRTEILLEKYFKNGFHCSDYNDIKRINESSLAEFGNILFEEIEKPDKKNFHTLQAIIERSPAQLIGRGTYTHVNHIPQISKDLAQKIAAYLQEKNDPISYSSVLKIFKTELKDSNITNRYLLKGALSHYENELFKGKRDYLLPLDGNETLRSKIKTWLISQTEFFTYIGFEKEFKGVAKSVFSTEISETKNFIHFWNRGYIYFKNFKITDTELKKLKTIVETSLKTIKIGHCTDQHIFLACKAEMPEFILRHQITYPYDIFNLVKQFFGQDFAFKRPLIGSLGTVFLDFNELLAEFIKDKEIINITELNKFIAPQVTTFKSTTVFEFIDMLKKQFMAISSNKLIRLDKVNFTSTEKDQLKKYLENKIHANPEVTLNEIICDKNFSVKIEINAKFEMNSFILAGLIICFYPNDFELIMKNEFFNKSQFGVRSLTEQK